jgi:multiple antibiotic resistance protein
MPSTDAHLLTSVWPLVKPAIQASAALLAITNPINAATVFVGLTEGDDPMMRRAAVRRVCLVVLVIMVGAALGGVWVLRAFGISLPAFEAAGGLVVLLMGLDMLRGQHTRLQHDHPQDATPDDQVLVPLAMPIIAGPGTMTTIVTLTTQRADGGLLPVLCAIAVTLLVLFVMLRASTWIDQHISPRTHRVFLRFMGLILLAVGVQLVLAGVHTFWIGG